jgi:hypothetical protein
MTDKTGTVPESGHRVVYRQHHQYLQVRTNMLNRSPGMFAALSLLLLLSLPCRSDEVAIHFAGETLYENADVRVTMNVNRFGRWCFGPQQQANISVIYKGDPDTDFGATDKYQQLFKDTLWKAVEARCSPIRMIRADHFVAGVRIAERDGSERNYSDRFLPGENEQPVYQVFVQNAQYGWQFTPGDTGKPTTLSARRASRPQDAAALTAQELNRATSLRQADVEKAIRDTFGRAPFNTTGMNGPDYMVRIFHGDQGVQMEEDYRFRLVFATYFAGFGIKCPAHLGKNAELVAVYQPTYGEQTTTWMNGRGFTWTTSMPVQTGKEKIAEVRVPQRVSTKVWLYAHSSQMTGISGSGSGIGLFDALNPEKSAKIAQEFEENRSNLIQLFENYSCTSPELKLLAENLHRISQREQTLQDEAIGALARKVATSPTPTEPRLSEHDLMQQLSARRD